MFDVGQARLAATQAQVGDSLSDDLIKNMTDWGLERFGAALYARGLEFGEVSESGPSRHDPTAWLVYPVGNPGAVFK